MTFCCISIYFVTNGGALRFMIVEDPKCGTELMGLDVCERKEKAVDDVYHLKWMMSVGRSRQNAKALTLSSRLVKVCLTKAMRTGFPVLMLYLSLNNQKCLHCEGDSDSFGLCPAALGHYLCLCMSGHVTVENKQHFCNILRSNKLSSRVWAFKPQLTSSDVMVLATPVKAKRHQWRALAFAEAENICIDNLDEDKLCSVIH